MPGPSSRVPSGDCVPTSAAFVTPESARLAPRPADGVEDADGGLTGVVPRGDVLPCDPSALGHREP